MAIIVLAPQLLNRNAVAETFTGSLSTSNTYTVNNNGNVFLHFKKTAAVNCIVTVLTQGVVDGLAVADKTFTVPASTGDVIAGPWPSGIYNDANGDLVFSMDDIDGVTVAVLRLH